MLKFQPRSLLVMAVFLVIFGTMLGMAEDARTGIATAGVLSLVAYLAIEVFLTFNPAGWRERRNGRR